MTAGLHYNWNRYYDPETGRYISPDPIGLAGGISLYGYAGGDSVNAIDPWGLCKELGESAVECSDRVAKEVLGDKLEILDNFGYYGASAWAISGAASSTLFANITNKTASNSLKDLQIAGALTEGNIITKSSASKKG